MIWIIGSIVLILLGIMVMSLLIVSGRTNDRMINIDRMESNKEIESCEKKAP